MSVMCKAGWQQCNKRTLGAVQAWLGHTFAKRVAMAGEICATPGPSGVDKKTRTISRFSPRLMSCEQQSFLPLHTHLLAACSQLLVGWPACHSEVTA